MGVAKPLFTKLFLEGIEVPIVSATITSNVGQASIAYIEVVPLAEIVDIKPRTHVLISVRDLNNPDQDFPYIKAWEGEVFGFSMSKTPQSRNITLSAIDLSSYWDNALLYFFNAQQSLGKGGPEISAIGQDVKDAQRQGFKTQATTHSLSSYFIEILKSALSKDGTDFLDGLVEIYKNTENVNSFFASAEARLRITDRIRLRSSGELGELLKAQQGLEWITGIVGQDSGYSTIRQTVQKLMSLIFHDFVSLPFPSKVSVDAADLRGDGIKTSSKKVSTQGDFIFKPNFYMMPPPACNIFYPDEYSQFSYSRMFFQEPTRLIYQPQMPSVLGTQNFAMEHVYEPNSFQQFMLEKEVTAIGDGPLDVVKDPGLFGDVDKDAKSKQTNQGAKREGQFLTNEERMRGILMSREGMAPASTLFRAILDKDQQRKIGTGIANYLFFKKRFEARSLQISSQLKLSVVPGFTTLVLDPQDPKLSLVAYCSSVTHRFTATQGGYTTVSLNYARTVDEQDTASSNTSEPPIPPWFSPSVFGGDKDANGRVNYATGISAFYADLIGSKGNRTVSELFDAKTMLDGVTQLIKEYETVKSNSTAAAVSDLISKRTDRDYVKLGEAMSFLGASTTTKDLNTPFVFFEGDEFSGKTGDSADQVNLRRDVILKYRNKLAQERGFNG